MKKLLLAASAAAVMFAALPDASARSARVNQVPNGLENSCMTCHTVSLPQVGNGPLNDFGVDVDSNLTGGGAVNTQEVDWPAVCELDSDGDGFTNGEELGDPDCAWTRGSQAGEYQSDPADASSTPGGGGEDAGGDAGTDAGGEDAGGEEDTGVSDDAGDGMDAGMGDDTGGNGGGNDGGGGDDEGCSTASADAPVSAAVALLALMLAGAWRRRK
jgi:MYXO-CTERM domain-containing protein